MAWVIGAPSATSSGPSGCGASFLVIGACGASFLVIGACGASLVIRHLETHPIMEGGTRQGKAGALLPHGLFLKQPANLHHEGAKTQRFTKLCDLLSTITRLCETSCLRVLVVETQLIS